MELTKAAPGHWGSGDMEMTEETGLALKEELDDLRDQFRLFRNWIICGSIGILFSLIAHASIAAWYASQWSVQLTQNERRDAELKIMVERNSEDRLRRSSDAATISDIRAELKTMREMMQSVRDDVMLMKASKTEK